MTNRRRREVIPAFLKIVLSTIAGIFLAVFPAFLFRVALAAPVKAYQKPNIVVIMGDDIGWFNIGAYHRGIMAGKTPHIDKLASDGMMFTDYYAQASSTAGRAAFITGELPIRTGMTTVGQAGADIGIPAEAPTIATVLKSMGYVTGQFGKNHLGDKNKFLPTVHGFDEFFGYLYHLDAMEDPAWHSYPPSMKEIVGPRDMIHSWATNKDDTTIQKRWGKIGKQKIVDAGTLYPERMKTVDDEILKASFNFMDKAKKNNKPFFVWLNPTRMHVYTHLSKKYEKTMTPENGWYTYEAGMKQFDDIVGSVMAKLKEMGVSKNTIIVVTTDNGAEVFTWPDGGQTPFKGAKGMATEGGFRVPMLVSWPGHIPTDKVQNGIMTGLDWLPTLVAAAGNPDIVKQLKQGKVINDRKYKVHLDGYNQLNMLTGKGPSNRHEVFYFAESNLGAVRIGDYKYVFIDQPDGWFGPKVKLAWPQIYNLRLDPFERISNSPIALMTFTAHEMWRFVYAQKEVAKLAKTFIEFPPMQKGASFNLDAVKSKIQKAISHRVGQ